MTAPTDGAMMEEGGQDGPRNDSVDKNSRRPRQPKQMKPQAQANSHQQDQSDDYGHSGASSSQQLVIRTQPEVAVERPANPYPSNTPSCLERLRGLYGVLSDPMVTGVATVEIRDYDFRLFHCWLRSYLAPRRPVSLNLVLRNTPRDPTSTTRPSQIEANFKRGLYRFFLAVRRYGGLLGGSFTVEPQCIYDAAPSGRDWTDQCVKKCREDMLQRIQRPFLVALDFAIQLNELDADNAVKNEAAFRTWMADRVMLTVNAFAPEGALTEKPVGSVGPVDEDGA